MPPALKARADSRAQTARTQPRRRRASAPRAPIRRGGRHDRGSDHQRAGPALTRVARFTKGGRGERGAEGGSRHPDSNHRPRGRPALAGRRATDEPDPGAPTMSDSVSELAAQSGSTPGQAKKGLGAVLAYFKESVPEEAFAKVSAAVPGSDQMMAAAGPAEQPSGGVLGAIKDVAGKLFGGGGASALISKLSNLGISAEQAQKFLPKVLEFLKGKLP